MKVLATNTSIAILRGNPKSSNVGAAQRRHQVREVLPVPTKPEAQEAPATQGALAPAEAGADRTNRSARTRTRRRSSESVRIRRARCWSARTRRSRAWTGRPRERGCFCASRPARRRTWTRRFGSPRSIGRIRKRVAATGGPGSERSRSAAVVARFAVVALCEHWDRRNAQYTRPSFSCSPCSQSSAPCPRTSSPCSRIVSPLPSGADSTEQKSRRDERRRPHRAQTTRPHGQILRRPKQSARRDDRRSPVEPHLLTSRKLSKAFLLGVAASRQLTCASAVRRWAAKRGCTAKTRRSRLTREDPRHS